MAQTTTQSDKPAATLRVAFVGCGNIMNKHARHAAENPEVEIVGLCDVSQASMDALIARSLAHMASPPPQFTDPARMYAATKPDAVVIASPHTMHHAHACQALDAGCHILMEKPMVTDLKDAMDLDERVRKAGKVFCIAYNTPCSAELYTLREMIRHNELGKLKVVSLYLSQNWYRLTKGKWRQDPALSGGGQMYDSGAHLFCSLVWTVESDVDEVYAHIDKLDTAVDINGTATIRFANGVMGSVAVTGQGPMGSHGTWIFEEGRVDLDPWSAGFMEVYGLEGRIKYPQMRGTDDKPFGNFISAILGRDEPRTAPINGVQQSQLMDAIYRSADTGQPAKPQV